MAENTKTILDIADKIRMGTIPAEGISGELIKELVMTGYDIEEEEAGLVQSWQKLYQNYVLKNDAKGCADVLRGIAENIEYILKREEYWAGLIRIKTEKNNNTIAEGYYDVREIFMNQSHPWIKNIYNRYDTVVRYLAIENYYHKNENGFYLYEKMQGNRMGREEVKFFKSKFRKLISSFAENGYDLQSAIECDEKLRLIDGSHRMAMCLYHKIPKVKINVYNVSEKNSTYYGIDWFRKSGFTRDEIQQIEEKRIELYELCKVPFIFILWPAAQAYFEEITEEIGKTVDILTSRDVVYPDIDFLNVVNEVHHISGVEDFGKSKSLTDLCGRKMVRILKVSIDNPEYRLEGPNQKPVSGVVEGIKSSLCSAYKDKIENCYHDYVIDAGNNYEENERLEKLFDLG